MSRRVDINTFSIFSISTSCAPGFWAFINCISCLASARCKGLKSALREFRVKNLKRCLLPEIQKFFESPEGKKGFEEWKAQRTKETEKKRSVWQKRQYHSRYRRFCFSTKDILKIRNRPRLKPSSNYHYLVLVAGLEPAQDCSRRILSPLRLPIPPHQLNGWRRIRTFEGGANRFTVCPLWPLGNPSICQALNKSDNVYLYHSPIQNARGFLPAQACISK